MKTINNFILEKLKISNVTPFVWEPTTEVVPYSNFKKALEEYGTYDLSKLMGNNLPTYKEGGYKYTVMSIGFNHKDELVYFAHLGNPKYYADYKILDVDHLREILGSDIKEKDSEKTYDKGNYIMVQIHHEMLDEINK